VPTLETPMSPGGSQASAGEGLSPCNIGIGIGICSVSPLQPLRVEVEAYGLDDLRHECIFADVQQQLGDGSTAVTYNMRLLDPSTLDGATMQHIDEVQGKLPTVPHLSVSLPPGTELVIKVAKLPDNRHSADTKHVMFASEHNVMAEAV